MILSLSFDSRFGFGWCVNQKRWDIFIETLYVPLLLIQVAHRIENTKSDP